MYNVLYDIVYKSINDVNFRILFELFPYLMYKEPIVCGSDSELNITSLM